VRLSPWAMPIGRRYRLAVTGIILIAACVIIALYVKFNQRPVSAGDLIGVYTKVTRGASVNYSFSLELHSNGIFRVCSHPKLNSIFGCRDGKWSLEVIDHCQPPSIRCERLITWSRYIHGGGNFLIERSLWTSRINLREEGFPMRWYQHPL